MAMAGPTLDVRLRFLIVIDLEASGNTTLRNAPTVSYSHALAPAMAGTLSGCLSAGIRLCRLSTLA